MARLTGVIGLLTMLGLAYAFSTNRRAIRLLTVVWGLGLQITFAFLVLEFDLGRRALAAAGSVVNQVLAQSVAGSYFVFGKLGVPGSADSNVGFVFAFQVLPTIIFVSSLFAVLYHLGIMQFVIRQVARLMAWTMKVSGAESLNVAASIFMGQTEAPLTIRPFLPQATRSELMTIMTAGMAHVSGGIMAAYIAYGVEAKHLLAAVIMTAPGTILISKMLVPETEHPVTAGRVKLDAADMPREANILGAIARGTLDGLQLALNVAAMLIAFIALIALINLIFGGIHHLRGFAWFPEKLQVLFGWIFAPVAWVIGVPWGEAAKIGNLLGTRMVINELVAFSDLGAMKASLSYRSFTIATFALTGFANFSSIGIQIGGIGALAPDKRGELAQLGLRAMLAGTMANLMSASIVGMMI